MIAWTSITKSLLPSLLLQAQDGEPVEPFTKGELPSLTKKSDLPARSRFGEGRGEIFTTICRFNYGLLSKYVKSVKDAILLPLNYFKQDL